MSRPSGGPLDTATAVSAPAPAFEIDAAALADYLRSNVPSFPEAHPMRVLKFTHGQSNPTYLLEVRVCFCGFDSLTRNDREIEWRPIG